ncbi:E3 ubiquitin-protein ligase rad18 [Mortierella hygrophila]|uniref:Postreplication repair E3 ubiquitin-protein ligase RAD18 n=1 Tax=Mortierella hygrophila TaxID=979708 RepID=A0A9P6FDK9_9FUNG|nr:E3 ubiquitin-protein ligase rad18 [Mortierella hygrophila]
MSEGITDPSDWPIEFKSLREIDSHLRCPICKELLRAAVVLQCSHNFCSECIRRHLDKESSCPACRVATSTSQMRRNVALDEIANNFGDCRSLLLNTLMEAVQPKPVVRPVPPPQFVKEESMDIDYDSPQQKRRRTSTRITNRNVSSSQDHTDIAMGQVTLDDDKDDDFVLNHRDSSPLRHKGKNVHRSTGPVLRSRGGRAEQTLSQSSQSSQADERHEPTNLTKQEPSLPTASDHFHNSAPAPAEVQASLNSSTNITSSTITTSVASIASSPVIGPNLVACPICDKGIPEPYTNTHLDKFCLAGRTDPDYTVPYSLISKQPASVIALYTKQGTSTRDVVPDTNSSLTKPGTPGRSVGSNSSTPNSPARQSTMQWQPQMSSNGTAPRQPMFTPKPAAPEPKRIPKLTYSLLNDKQLRKKLQELGLQTNGDKTLMAKRHAEFATIFNANCDSTRPKPLSELMKAMQVWERAYEKDLEVRETQRRILDQQQQAQRQIHAAKEAKRQAKEDAAAAAAREAAMDSPGATPPSSQSSNGRSTFVPNQANSNAVNVAIASASAFAHAAKYADEYAELIAEVRNRLQADKEKALANTTTTITAEPAPPRSAPSQ